MWAPNSLDSTNFLQVILQSLLKTILPLYKAKKLLYNTGAEIIWIPNAGDLATLYIAQVDSLLFFYIVILNLRKLSVDLEIVPLLLFVHRRISTLNCQDFQI